MLRPTWTSSNIAQQAAGKHLPENLKGFRAEYDLSQEALSERAGFHRTYVSQLERQATDPTLDTMVAIAIALAVELTDLLSERKSPPATLLLERRPAIKAF
ncbi:helix-turn-helix domain-containing protein [Paraburkholderia sp. BL25I1N1]|uniref:helix-turn-helix domain-containing protein n=1 Tax=Paraburkholderia sp. BL25I1N1 TaxID=1938804 RepID=UPI000D05DFFF|nr:helix-turn-helix transcriptional regulator [Paraburkholderia sp. BL25I1N1]PRY05921.1 helix-turn-helix protein [Paraburkholderia sp. BL25I1N1]